MALDIITASQGDTCAIIQIKCYPFIPDESANVSSLLNYVRTQVNALRGPIPSPGDFLNQSSDHGALNGKYSYFGPHDLSLCFLLHVLSCY